MRESARGRCWIECLKGSLRRTPPSRLVPVAAARVARGRTDGWDSAGLGLGRLLDVNRSPARRGGVESGRVVRPLGLVLVRGASAGDRPRRLARRGAGRRRRPGYSAGTASATGERIEARADALSRWQAPDSGMNRWVPASADGGDVCGLVLATACCCARPCDHKTSASVLTALARPTCPAVGFTIGLRLHGGRAVPGDVDADRRLASSDCMSALPRGSRSRRLSCASLGLMVRCC
jgi:hypothetical protein